MNANKFNLAIVSWQQAQHDIRFVRDAVFVDELGIPSALEWDGTDADYCYVYVIARDSAGNPVGTGRIGNDGHIGRMAVLTPWRGQGVGSEILQQLLRIAGDRYLSKVWLSAQSSVTDFYTRHGFSPEGEVYTMASIDHQKMSRPILEK